HVIPSIVDALKESSQARRLQSEDFRKLTKNIDRYMEQKAKKEVPLNEQKFLARRAELDSEKEEEKLFEDNNENPDEVVKRDYYFNEVMAITVDYLRLLGKDKVARATP